MNRRMIFCRGTMLVWLLAALAAALPVAAGPVAKAPPPPEPVYVPVPSFFVIPRNPTEGRDPFYPNSPIPRESVPGIPGPQDFTLFILGGISGPPEHRLVIINNRTFATGEEGDISTKQGKIHIRCISIETNSVTIESGGKSQKLDYKGTGKPLKP